ncbi:MAG: hypothetical protein L7G91_04895 [Acidilobus sp.]|nr:hypothetical protein [Acidilobus sp.]MCG2891503.1 hypothetical protein [Acidilobus sp.]
MSVKALRASRLGPRPLSADSASLVTSATYALSSSSSLPAGPHPPQPDVQSKSVELRGELDELL